MNEQFNWVKNREEIDWGRVVEERKIMVSLFSLFLLTEMSHIYYFPWLKVKLGECLDAC